MNFTTYPGFFSDYFIRASKSYAQSLKLFSLYLMLAPEACLDRAEGSRPASLRGVGEEWEALQAGPAPRSPSDAQAEHGPAAPPPGAPSRPRPLSSPPAGHRGIHTAEPLPQPTQSGDGGLALRPRTHQVVDGAGAKAPAWVCSAHTSVLSEMAQRTGCCRPA